MCPSHSNVGIHFECPSTLFFFLPISEVRDPLTHVSHISTTINYFDSSVFGSFNLSPLTFFQSDFTQSQRSVDACFSQINDHDLLWEFSTLVTPLSSEVAIFWNGRYANIFSQLIDGSDKLRLSDLWDFLFNTSPFLSEWLSSKLDYLKTLVPLAWMAQICFVSSSFRSVNLSTLTFSQSAYTQSRCIFSTCPCSQIDDTYRIRYFADFQRSSRLSA